MGNAGGSVGGSGTVAGAGSALGDAGEQPREALPCGRVTSPDASAATSRTGAGGCRLFEGAHRLGDTGPGHPDQSGAPARSPDRFGRQWGSTFAPASRT
jgi:hypothetical protein